MYEPISRLRKARPLMHDLRVHGVRPVPPTFDISAQMRTRRIILPLGLGTFLVFLLIQYLLLTARFHADFSSYAERYGLAAARALQYPVGAFLLGSATSFLAASIGSLTLVARGRRRLFAVPAPCAVLLPWLANRLGVFTTYPLGGGWLSRSGLWPLGRFWVGAAIDLGLALAPALALLALEPSPQKVHSQRGSRHVDLDVASFAFCLSVLGIFIWVRATLLEPVAGLGGALGDRGTDLPVRDTPRIASASMASTSRTRSHARLVGGRPCRQ